MRNVYSGSDLRKLFLLFTALGLLEFWYRYLDYIARGRSIRWLIPFLEQLTGNYASFVLLVVLITPLTLAFRPDRSPWQKWLPIHAGAMLLYSLLHTSMMWASRLALFPLLGLGKYDYGLMPVRYAMEFPSDLVSFAINTGAVVVFRRMREANAREIQLAQLQAGLAQAQLENLTLQLQPHFLFNALNAVAATVYEDPRKADMMLSRLGDYLRRTLKSSSAQQVTLESELEMLELYVSVMKARFEDDLQMKVTVDKEAKGALVPQLILQPIVENAIRHGFDPASSKVFVEVLVARSDGDLLLSVRDHGRGLAPSAAPRIGLSNTQSRLERLHGSNARFSITNSPRGGTEVEIRIPFQLAGNAA